MSRIPFSQIIKVSPINIQKEYERLFQLFYKDVFIGRAMRKTLNDLCKEHFLQFPYRGTCLSLDDYCDTHDIHFEEYPGVFDLDYLVSFSEYTYNMLSHCASCVSQYEELHAVQKMRFYFEQVQRVMELIGYMANNHEGIIDFVPKDQAAISVAEIVDPQLSYRVIEYNHHSMRGDIERKKDILFHLGEQLEPNRKKLKRLRPSLEDNVFFLLNNMNIRHNNIQKGGKEYHSTVANMSREELEIVYDELYQMLLLSFLELDNSERMIEVDRLKERFGAE